MPKQGDFFHYGYEDQRFEYHGAFRIPASNGKTKLMLKWVSTCVDCNKPFDQFLSVSFPMNVKGLVRRCKDHVKAGHRVSTKTRRQEEAEWWRPRAYAYLHDVLSEMNEDRGEPVLAVELAREIAARGDTSTDLKARLQIGTDRAGTRVGEMLRFMAKKEWVEQDENRHWRACEVDPDEDFGVAEDIADEEAVSYDEQNAQPVKVSSEKGRSKKSNALDLETLLNCAEIDRFTAEQMKAWEALGKPRRTIATPNAMDERFVGKNAQGQPIAKQRLLNFLLEAARRAADNPTRYFDMENFRQSVKSVPSQDQEAKEWAVWLIPNDQALSGLIGQLYLAQYIQLQGSGFVLKG